MQNILTFCDHHKEAILIAVILVSATLLHGVNMFSYPYYENDEGAYISQGWAISEFGKLAPYTYWYDHAPAGWILVTLWSSLTGGYFTFGLSPNSGRALMLVVHVISALLVYLIGKAIAGRKWPAVIAVMIFCLSPLGIYFQRRLLLDNIMAMWLLVSICLLLKKTVRLRDVAGSAVAFAIAVLTKENAIFALPGLVYGVYLHTHPSLKSFALSIWLTISGSLISLYVLFALLKGELFPAAHDEHVSLLGTLRFHSGRGNGLAFWNSQSDFYVNFMEWINTDPYVIYLGLAGFLINIILMIKYKNARMITLVTFFSLLFLARGGLVINFYILPLIPLLALCIAISLHYIVTAVTTQKYILYPFYLLVMIGLAQLFTSLPNFDQLYTRNETRPQTEVIQWIKENLNETDTIIIDGYAYVDLHDNYYNEKQFINADWFWKVTEDPEVRDKKLQNDWRNVQYVVLSHEMARQIRFDGHKLLTDALDHAIPIKVFSTYEYSTLPGSNLRDLALYNTDVTILYKVFDERIQESELKAFLGN